VGSYDNTLSAVDAESGALAWSYRAKNFINGAAAVSGGLAVFGGCDSLAHLVDAATGREQAVIPVGGYVAGSTALLRNASGESGRTLAVMGRYDGVLLAVDLQARRIAWQFENPAQAPYLATPALTDTRVVAAAQDGSVTCHDAQSGNLRWQFTARGSVESSPLIMGVTVLVATMDGLLQVISLNTGKELWRYDMGQSVISSPAAAAGKIVIGCDDGYLYAFGNPTGIKP
jgi:outer membrane protein assembly factor BamB